MRVTVYEVKEQVDAALEGVDLPDEVREQIDAAFAMAMVGGGKSVPEDDPTPAAQA